MNKKEQMIRDFANALKNAEHGEQVVSVYDDGDEHLSVSVELDSWRGNEYYIFGLKGYADGEVADGVAYMMIERKFIESHVFDEAGGIDGAVQLIADQLIGKEEESKPDEEGVPAE
jgi:hypothetical protein